MDQNIFQTVYKVNHAGGSGSCFYLKRTPKKAKNSKIEHLF